MDWQSLMEQYQWMLKPLMLTGAILVLSVIAGVVLKRLLDVAQPKVPIPAIAYLMLRRVVRFAVLIIALAGVLIAWGLDLSALLATIGGVLAMVAIGFVAVWSLLSNILCAFVLTAFRPFRIGDEVEVLPEGVKGRVVDLTLLYTSLRTPEGDLFQVPNNMFFQKMFRCRAGDKPRELGEQLLKSEPAQ